MTVPFLETRPRAASRRLLLVTYAFPPDASVGALRWEMMLRFAAEFDWNADVLMMDPADSRDSDESRLASLPAGLRLFGIPFLGSTLDAILRWRRRLRGPGRTQTDSFDEFSENGDAELASESALGHRLEQLKCDIRARMHYAGWRRWSRDAAAVGIALARETDYACVVSSGPPHMAHDAARQIAAAISRPLIVDYRDPWTSADAEPLDMSGETWRALSHRLELACVAAAALIVANTESAARLMRSKYPTQADRVITIRNGADPIPTPPPLPAKPFTISYAGSLYGGRRPQALFRALRQVVERDNLSSDDIRLHFMGVEASQRTPLLALAKREAVEPFFNCETRRPRAEAQALLDRSAMVVLLPQIHVHSVPAKVYEYVQRPVWMLVLSEPSTAIAELLSDTAADIVSPDDVEAIATVMTRRLREARSGARPEALNADGRFSRERQARLFFRELDQVVVKTNEPVATGSISSQVVPRESTL
jgi:hypothetical protein